MKFVIQRVNSASVTVENKIVGSINRGFLVLIGVCGEDTEATADKLVKKMLGLRIFEDSEGKTNLSLESVGGDLLLVSQFTLYADCRKGNRPSFVNAGSPEHAEKLYDYIVASCKKAVDEMNRQHENNKQKVETGIFGAMMDVTLENSGPFTIILDSRDL